MNRSKWMSVAAVLTLSTTMAFAAPGGEGHGRFGGKRGHGGRGGEFAARFAQKLNLTDAQKQQIRELHSNFREQNKAFFESTRETRQQVKAAREARDTARLEALKGTIASQREQMKQLREKQHERIVALLTPEQRAKLETLKAERKDRRAERGERRHGKRGHGRK